jgi:menaquinone-specific isochorismate synthase
MFPEDNDEGAPYPDQVPSSQLTTPGPNLIAITRPAPAVDDLIDALPAVGGLCWSRRGEGLVGWGIAARLQVRGVERFSRAQRWWTEFCERTAIDDSVSVPGTGPIAFASFAFDSDEPSELVVPKVLIGQRAGQAWVTTIHAEGKQPPETDWSPERPQEPTGVTWGDGALSAEEWEKAVALAVERISGGELDKVVLARDVIAHVDGQLDPRLLLHRLAAAYPTCWTFNVAGLLGATPELLVRRTGDLVTSRVLAGTVRRRGDSQEDQGLARALLASDKDLAEHDYAVKSVAKSLAVHCTDMDVPETPGVLELANVQHLATEVTGRLADDASLLALAASLHPTAAVCGTPTERAQAMIAELEGMSRGRYAGPVGWFDARGEGELGIALRCAEVDTENSTVRAFAGCGIVAGSDPERELAESRAKLVPIRDALTGSSN